MKRKLISTTLVLLLSFISQQENALFAQSYSPVNSIHYPAGSYGVFPTRGSESLIKASEYPEGLKDKVEENDLGLYAPAGLMLLTTGVLNVLGNDGLGVINIDGRSNFPELLVAGFGSALLTVGITEGLKNSVERERPDGSDYESFPSGHTSMTFMAATMLTKEYGHYSPWVGIAAYGVASGVAIQRVCVDRHYVSDVLTGAAIGIGSVEASYWLTKKIFKKSDAKLTLNTNGKSCYASVKVRI